MARKKSDSVKRFTVKVVPIAAAPFLTISDAHYDEQTVIGAFVRIRSPETMSDEELSKLRAKVIEQGAIAVRVLPRRQAQVLTTPKVDMKTRSIREVIVQMVAESNTTDRAALTEVVEHTMAKVGL